MKKFIGKNYLVFGLIITASVLVLVFGLFGECIRTYILNLLGSISLGYILGRLTLSIKEWGES